MHLSISRPFGENYLVVLHPKDKIAILWQGMKIIDSIKVKEYYEGQFDKVYQEFKNKY
jgi:hypothetical protein